MSVFNEICFNEGLMNGEATVKSVFLTIVSGNEYSLTVESGNYFDLTLVTSNQYAIGMKLEAL